MKRRNVELHAEIDRIADLKMQIPSSKSVATKFNTSPATIRVMLSRAISARKLTNAKIHVKQ